MSDTAQQTGETQGTTHSIQDSFKTVKQPQDNFVFPQEIEVSLRLTIGVTTQEERDAYLDAKTGALTVGFQADATDTFYGYQNEVLLAVNGLKPEQLKALLEKETKNLGF